MSAKSRSPFRIGLAIAFLVGAALACGPTPSGGAVSVVINSPLNGSTVVVGQEVLQARSPRPRGRREPG